VNHACRIAPRAFNASISSALSPASARINAEVLGKVCGLGAEELAKLKAEGVI